MKTKKITRIIHTLATTAVIAFLLHQSSSYAAQQLPRPDIVLITLDTWRSDHATYMGYPRNTTPFLNGLASTGVLFKKMRTLVPFTTPSHESIFSALNPQNQDPAIYQTFLPITNQNPPSRLQPLENDEAHQTLPLLLKSSGYKTAAFTAVAFMDIFQKRFDHFELPISRKIKNYHRSSTRHTAEEIVTNAIAWLKKTNANRTPRFIWLHFFDAHYPYIKNMPYKALAEDPEDSTMTSYWQQQGAHLELFTQPRQKNIMETFNNYDGQLQYIDSQIERLSSYITSQKPQKDTLWIIIPDHGEGLTSHDYYNHHKRLYEEQLLTPAIIVYPGKFQPHTDICDTANTDILPTIAAITRHPLTGNRIDGQSLLERLKGNTPCPTTETAAVATREFPKLPIEKPKIPTKLPIDMPDEGQSPSLALYRKPYKYIYDTNGNSQLYDIEKDPIETVNLIKTKPEIADKMQARAKEIYKENTDYWKIGSNQNTIKKPLTGKDKKRLHELKSLGY